jgi:uncharacterized membrane protein
MSQSVSPAITFLLFTVASFLMLRYVLANFARDDRAKFAPPILIFAGAVSGVLFFRLQLGQYLIWFLMIFALILIRWHATSRPEGKKVQEIVSKIASEETAKADTVQTYTMTRRLLSFALVSYLAAFSAVFYYLFTRAG